MPVTVSGNEADGVAAEVETVSVDDPEPPVTVRRRKRRRRARRQPRHTQRHVAGESVDRRHRHRVGRLRAGGDRARRGRRGEDEVGAVAESAAACRVTFPVVPICVNVTVRVCPGLAARYDNV